MRLVYPEIDPIIFSFSVGNFEIALRWYALSYILGILVAWKLMQILAKHSSLWPNNFAPISSSAVEDLMTYMILGIILGGRIGYVVFYQPVYFLQNPEDILKVWNGGMSFHGGFLGVVFGAVLYAKTKRINLLSLGDLIAVASPPGLFFGRLANFINGELWGKPTTSPLGVVFPARDAKICPINWVGECTRHPSQLYEAVSEGLLLWAVMLICVLWFKSFKRRGETMFIFLIGYGISRVIVEIFREPDAQFTSEFNPNGYLIFISETIGLSMGQILCLPMIIVGAVSLFMTRFFIHNRD
jgi:phosphatidylglycerol:prolipoprotein diacylglycerol transferase